jgi:hypothetical protein
MNMNDCRKNSVTFLIVSLSVYKYRVRNMYKIVTKSVNMNLIRSGTQVHAKSSRDYASFRIQKTNVSTSSHEQAQANPIMQGSKNYTFQHPSIVRDVCQDAQCESKTCNTLCSNVERSSHVAHGTHDGTFPGAAWLSNKDLNNKSSNQYAVIYKNPVPNIDPHGVHTDPKMTANLQNNAQMLSTIQKSVNSDNLSDFNALKHAQDIDNENIN